MARRKWEEISYLNQVDQFDGREGRKEGKKKKKRERKKKEEEEEKMTKKLYLISKICGDRAVGFHKSKRKSSSTR